MKPGIALSGVVLLIGCVGSTPSPSPTASQSMGSPAPVASPSSPPASESPILASGTIDQQYTTPALEYRSTGTYLVWSSGARADPRANAPDLFGCEPGESVSLLYDNPNRDSRLELVGGDGERIVFVEDNTRVFGRGRWKMWYLDHPGAAAKLIDEGAGKLPFFDVAGTSLVWTTMAGQQSESQLWLLDLATMDRRLLVSEDSAVTQYWFPSIDGDLVAYATLELAPDGRSEVRHVYLLDVDDVAPPRQLDATGTASMPEINGDTVVWKESSLQFSHVNAGRLVRYSLASGGIEPLTLNPHSFRYPGGDLYTFPSIGSRYVAAWSGYDRALYLADLKTGAPLEILDLGLSDDDHHASVGLIADLTGDLLAYLYGPANEGDLELRWVVLRD